MSPFRGSVPFTDDWKHFDVSREAGVTTITFNRPDKLNALTFEGYADLRDFLAELPHRDDTRVVVLRGEGRSFCSSGNINEIIGATLPMRRDELLSCARTTGEVVRAMRASPVPVIAATHGTAAGAGSVLALAADFRIMTRSAKFAFLFTKVGLAGADMGAAYLLPRLVGLGRATELLVLGDKVTSERAEAIGLATQVVSDEELPAAAAALAKRLADGPALAYATTKVLLTRELDMDLGSAIELEAMTQALLMKSADHSEFYAAWSQGRSPQWTGR